MDGILQAELFATKGLEYAAVLVYLGFFVGFWRLLRNPEGEETGSEAAPKVSPAGAGEDPAGGRGGWFSLPQGFLFHQGHTWVRRDGEREVRVGMDEFTRKLLGPPASFSLPPVGAQLKQGDQGWAVEVDGKTIPILSPMDGEVVEVNPLALEAPREVLDQPYGQDGWLLKIRVREAESRTALANLLSGNLARAWIREVEERIRGMHSPELGLVLPDGGEPVDGLAQVLSPEDWDDLARSFLWPDPC